MAAGLAALVLLARAFVAGPGADLAGAGAVVMAAACYWANRNVLPRLYPWFHLTLSAAFLAASILAARLALVSRAGRWGRAAGRWGAWRWSRPVRLAAAAPPVEPHRPLRRPRAHPAHGGALAPGAGAAHAGDPALRHPRARAEEPLPEGPHRPNADVVLITIDALRADHVGAYGYPAPTTPEPRRPGQARVRFERAYAQAPHTSFSVPRC
jgi:hypothetical protein